MLSPATPAIIDRYRVRVVVATGLSWLRQRSRSSSSLSSSAPGHGPASFLHWPHGYDAVHVPAECGNGGAGLYAARSR